MSDFYSRNYTHSRFGKVSKIRIDNRKAFTIVELLVVIVVIGILASITIVAFTGISSKAITAAVKSDLGNNATQLKLYNAIYGSYPTSLDGNSCPSAPSVDTKYCMKVSTGNSVSYVGTTQTFVLNITNTNGVDYSIDESGNIILVSSIFTPSSPTITVSLNGSNIQAVITPISCTSGVPQYGIKSRTNDGTWGSYSAWSTNLTVTQPATDDTKYGYQAESRCYTDATNFSLAAEGVESTYTKSIVTPSAPTVSQNNVGTTTTWSWPAVPCSAGAISYRYDYTISPSGFDSGWVNNGTNLSIGFTTSTTGQVYTVTVQAGCSGTYTTSSWSVSGSASYSRLGYLTFTGSIATGTGPNGVAITASGTSVYVTNLTSNTISMYSRNTSTGALTALATPTIATGTWPMGIVVSADGTSVYVANHDSNTISMYSRNTGTGALTALATPTIATGLIPGNITISADGTSVYVANRSGNTISMYSRNTGTGALTALATPTIATGTMPIGITISADGTSVYTENINSSTISMYSRNTGTGALTALATPTIATGAGPISLTISANGTSVYATNLSANTISMYSRNTGTGALTALATPTIATGANSGDIVVSADGASVYVPNGTSNTISMYSRNAGTGALTALATPTIATTANSSYIAISADGTSVYVANTNTNTVSVYSRN